MILKPRIALNVAMILGGAFVAYIGLFPVFALGLYTEILGLIPGSFGILGLAMICVGALALARRGRLVITIDETGISLPVGSLLQRNLRQGHIDREDIAAISKHESVKGRVIEITFKGGEKGFVQARHYCELEEFLSYCRTNGLPVN